MKIWNGREWEEQEERIINLTNAKNKLGNNNATSSDIELINKTTISPGKVVYSKDNDFKSNLETIGKNILKVPGTLVGLKSQALKGVVGGLEHMIVDPLIQLGSSKYNPGMWIATGETPWSKDQSKLNDYQNIAKEIIQDNGKQHLFNETLGYNKVLPNGKTLQQTIDDNSLIKSNNFAGAITEGIGNMLPSIALGYTGVGNAGAMLSMGANSYGSGVEEAYNDGANRGQANLYGVGNAAVESATEWLTGGIPGVQKVASVAKNTKLSKTANFLNKLNLDTLAEKGLNKVSNQVVKEVLNAGYKIIGEGSEEALSELLNPYLKNATYSKGEKIDGNAVLESFISGAITGGILEAPINASNIKGAIKQTLPRAVYNQNIANNQSILNENVQTDINIQKNKVVPQNGLNDIKYSGDNINSKYSYLPTANEKTNILRKSASQYFNNKKETIDLLNTIDKIIKDKNYNVLFDDTIVNSQNKSVNAQIKTLENNEVEIRLNPNSSRAGEFLLTHEITHAVETDNMKKLILDYASKNSDFNQSLEALKQTYGTNDVSSEVIADISGQLFGNQEFINNLSVKEPSVFKKIYNKIIEIANKITGNSKEGLFIRDLKNKWETAYRNTTTEQSISNLKNTKFSEVYNNDGTLNRIKINENIFENNNGKSINQTIKEYLENHIGDVYTIIESGQKVYLGEDLPGEYAYSKSAQSLPTTKKLAKGRAVTNLKEIVENSTNRKWEPYKHESHKVNAKYGFYKYDTTFSFNHNGQEKVYTGTVLIRNDANEKKYLYDILNLKPQKKLVNLPSVASNSEMSSARFDGSSNQPSGNISQSNTNVKSGTLPKYSMQNNQNNTQKLDNSSFNLKEKQNEIIQKSNPANDELHTWIRSVDDIKTLEETLQDDNWSDYDEFNPDLSKKDIENAIKTGKITVYSSYPIEQGIFVSPSKMEAESYSGTGKVYSKEVNIEDIAWIDPTQGQYAKVDAKYSQNNTTWQEYLEKNYKATGTRTDMRELKGKVLPKYSDLTNIQKSINNIEAVNKNSIKEINKQKIENNSNAIGRLKQEKNELEKRMKEKIKLKEELLKSKSNQDTKIATQLNIQISNLNNQLKNRKLDYDRRIKFLENKNKTMQSKEFKIKEQRITKKQQYIDLAYKLTENMVDWNDKTSGLKYKINTMERNLYDMMPKHEAESMYNTYFKPITDNNAKIEQFITSYNERVKKLNLNQRESIAVQMLGEYKYNSETLLTGLQVDEYIEKNKLNYNKLSTSVEEFRKIYDELLPKINAILKEQGYPEIDYRKGYFPHFIEETRQTKFSKLAEKLGFKVNNQELPTDIAGTTDLFKPGKTYFKNSQRRMGKITDYDALKGFDNYIRGAADLIFHTEDIQKLRALETVIRTQYTDKSIRDTIEKISNNPEYDMEQKQALIDLEFAKINNPLPNFVTELRDYTDSLANKKDVGDRGMEHLFGRNSYTIMKNIQSRVSANMVGFNISSALTNFIPITQAWGEVSTKNMAKAIKDSIANQFHNDGFDNCSTFLINRTKSADRLYKTKLDTINDKASVIFEAVDSITANVIVRGKYYDNIEKGMTELQAINNANNFAKSIMGGRDKGSMPTIFNKQSAFTKLLTAFQLEVNNQFGYMLKDLPRNLSNEAKHKLVSAFLKIFVGAWLYNKFSKSLTGRDSAFSPIDIAYDSIKTATNDNLSIGDKLSEVSKDLAGELPFVGGVFGGGRLPIQAAIPNTDDVLKNIPDAFTSDKARKTLYKELSKPIFYIAMPFGGGQLKKTIEGAKMYSKKLPTAGSYTDSGNLRFTADKSPIGVGKALLFGQYSSKEAQDYIESGYKTIKSTKISEMKDLQMNSTEYRNYNQGLTKAGKKNIDKVDYINKLEDITVNQKNIMLKNVIDKSDKDNLDKLNMSESQKNEYYNLKVKMSSIKSEKVKKSSDKHKEIADLCLNSNLSDEQLAHLYSKYYSDESKVNDIIAMKIPIREFIKYNSQEFESDYDGKGVISDSKKNKVLNYINGLNLNISQKAILAKMTYKSYKKYDNNILKYINSLNMSKYEKSTFAKKIGFSNYDDYLIKYILESNITKYEKSEKLKELGFTIKDNKIYK